MYYKHKAKSEALVLKVKTCDMLKLKWVRDWVQKYSNISVDACPLKITLQVHAPTAGAPRRRRGRGLRIQTCLPRTIHRLEISSKFGSTVCIRTMYYKHKAKSEALVLKVKTCDMLKLKWVRDWVQKYSNISVDACPLKIGSYRLSGFEVPPKNFPIAMGSEDNHEEFKMSIKRETTMKRIAILLMSLSIITNSEFLKYKPSVNKTRIHFDERYLVVTKDKQNPLVAGFGLNTGTGAVLTPLSGAEAGGAEASGAEDGGAEAGGVEAGGVESGGAEAILQRLMNTRLNKCPGTPEV
ncbi:hypothetical protein MSG28_012315 [Choristoneura fumiferana]|uniref:Uncharacterized protein n=1 Tax=Choristoneura fumiferana TaxID=7141 RepID=A0ACC0KDB0_CHOFU|nr:hypothetical protein MSG28_012315 [Choristoneura fumiferana]